MESRKVKLPSGAILEVQPAPFAESKALYQAILEEGKNVKVADMESAIKDLFCIGLSSKKIEAAMQPCLARALYDGEKILDQTFEPVDRRQDYLAVCMEVARENIEPFTKSLYAQFKGVLGQLKKLANVPA